MEKVKDEIKKYYLFYKENLKKKHIIIYIILLALLLISFAYIINSIDIEKVVADNINSGGNVSAITRESISDLIVKDKLPTNFLIIFAGITPYFYLSVLGFIYSYIFAVKIASFYTFAYSTMFLIVTTLGVIIQMVGIALSISMGMYFCKISTRRFRYFKYRGVLFNDIRKQYYTLRKIEEKVKAIEEKERLKKEKLEKDNVKIPYKELIISFCISFCIIFIGTVIARI